MRDTKFRGKRIENTSKIEKCSTCKGSGYLFYGTGDDTVCDECGGIGHMPVAKKVL